MKHLAYCPYTLKFRFNAGTSRGVIRTKKTFLVKIWDDEMPGVTGFGEVAWFKGLSCETEKTLLRDLKSALILLRCGLFNDIPVCSSVQYGVEQALVDLKNGGKGIYFKSPFLDGKSDIIINGLVWMGSYDTMLSRLKQKIEDGFHCIKIKIGAVKWEEEMALLRFIRNNYGDALTIRVDANGGLSPENYMHQLEELAEYNVHSIEQPLPAGDWEQMAEICRNSPVPVALDEELIGVRIDERVDLIEEIMPAYIVLKPALCGGLSGAMSWIELAELNDIGWWITSSLESSVGLDALAQFVAKLNIGDVVQGLGTGSLYHNNFSSPLLLEGDRLRFKGPADIFREELQRLEWIEINL